MTVKFKSPKQVRKELESKIESLGGREKVEKNKYSFAWDQNAANNLYKELKNDGWEIVKYEKGNYVRFEKVCEDDDVIVAILTSNDCGTYNTYEVKIGYQPGLGTIEKAQKE